MSVASADPVERSVHKTNEWLNEIRDELGHHITAGDLDDLSRSSRVSSARF
jgi:hypothetical protein